jgi:hypothetical protein
MLSGSCRHHIPCGLCKGHIHTRLGPTWLLQIGSFVGGDLKTCFSISTSEFCQKDFCSLCHSWNVTSPKNLKWFHKFLSLLIAGWMLDLEWAEAKRRKIKVSIWYFPPNVAQKNSSFMFLFGLCSYTERIYILTFLSRETFPTHIFTGLKPQSFSI